MKAKPAIKKTQGTFAVPRLFIPEGSPAYAEAQKLFEQIKWRKQPKRADAIKNRFNAFSSLLWAVTIDEGCTTYTDLNKASYDIKRWPINYDAMSQTVQALKDMRWLKGVGLRTKNRQLRYVAPPGSPMRKMASFKVSELVRHQRFWFQRAFNLSECLAHLVGFIMRRTCGVASA